MTTERGGGGGRAGKSANAVLGLEHQRYEYKVTQGNTEHCIAIIFNSYLVSS